MKKWRNMTNEEKLERLKIVFIIGVCKNEEMAKYDKLRKIRKAKNL